MLRITVPGVEFFDDANQEFITSDEVVLELEHSLVSLSVWESKWERAFLGPTKKSTEETLDYIRAMTLTPEIPPEVYSRLSNENLSEINDYINAKMTATTVNEGPAKPQSRELVTAEVIYYWMITLGVPFECQYWHLERLLMLIRVVNAKNAPQTKSTTSRAELAARHRAVNEEQRRRFGTSG